VLTHVKELVEQNHQKYETYGVTAGIYSAGLKLKETQHQVTFASIQSAARNLDDFSEPYSLIIIDECHRVNVATPDLSNEKSNKKPDEQSKEQKNSRHPLIFINLFIRNHLIYSSTL
jgi:DNA repair protein RadD